MDAVPRTALRKAASLVRITKGEMRRQRTVRVRGSAVQRAKALASDAGGTEGREPGTGARRHALRRQVKGLIENHRSDYRARNSLSCNMAETMTSVSGRLRLRRLDRCARGGCDRQRCGTRITGAGKGGKIMKKRNRDCQREAESQRPAPEETARSFAGNRLCHVAGSFHRKPLRPIEISPLGDVFKADAIGTNRSASGGSSRRRMPGQVRQDDDDRILSSLPYAMAFPIVPGPRFAMFDVLIIMNDAQKAPVADAGDVPVWGGKG